MRSLVTTLAMVLTIWLLAAPIMSGCGDGLVSDSNTNSVENVKRDDTADMDVVEAAEDPGDNKAFASMSEIRDAIVSILGDNYWPDKKLTKEELETETGISADMYEDYLAEKQSVETDIDMIIIIKAKEKYVGEVETILNEYRESLMTKYRDRPQELGKVEASRIETVDSYVSFVQLGADTEAAAQIGDEEVISVCQQDNESVVDIIEKTLFDE
ncbi:uncharacterized protein DUF4358 [Kineothrix alysoides]|uniref:Uncharacterized protein DUF4358 n=2 Tax=Kineothrix alysoides TaxID=1469948 RepID=A0A4R1QTF9_9FIRM|nr:uncharacterized protein DUF4358 [Kineothrix alysoides]